MRLSTRVNFAAIAVFLLAASSSADDAIKTTHVVRTDHASSYVRPASGDIDCRGEPLGIGAFIGGHDGNLAPGYDTAVLGGQSNHACADYSGIADGNQNLIGPHDTATQQDLIGSGGGNVISEASYSSIVSGSNNSIVNSQASGIGSGVNNHVFADSSFIGGGVENSISNLWSFIGGGFADSVSALQGVIGGGQSNTIDPGTVGGQYGAAYGVVAGGYFNSITSLISSGGKYGVISGGFRNSLTAFNGVISGGSLNVARGDYSVVPGGYQNTALGVATFAGGTGSQAVHDGTFLWSDHAAWATPLKSYGVNEFLVRASGGVALFSSANLKSGVKLAPGSGTWSSLSDRASKTHIVALNDADVLAKVEALPVSGWSYRTQDASIRHVGPMAQDFYAAFGVGEDDRHITSIDEDGVALAAIKGLAAEVEGKDSEMVSLRAEAKNRDLEVAGLKAETKDKASEMVLLKTEVAKLAARAAKLENEVESLTSRGH